MNQLFIFIFILLALMVIFIALGVYFYKHPEEDKYNDHAYIDKDGNHQYYDRSIIEKTEFLRRHPEEKGKVRTIKRLFRREK